MVKTNHSYKEQARANRIGCEIKTPWEGDAGILLHRNGKVVIGN